MVTFSLALGAAVVLTPIAARVARAVGLVDRPSDPSLEIHAGAVPILGGPAVIVAALAAAATAEHEAASMVAWGIGFALIVGLVDDAHPLPAVARLGLLGCAGLLLAAGGVRVEPFGFLAWAAVPAIAVVCANGINILDGQNGLAGGIAAAGAAGLAGVAGSAAPGARGLGFALAGGLVGFLAWNLRGRIFLGNGGAYAVGVTLAALAALTATAHGWRGVLAAAVCLALIPFEIVTTLARRARAGAALFPGDRDHTYDIAARAFGSRVKSTVLFWILAGAAAGTGIAVARLPLAGGVAVLAVIVGASAAAARFLGRAVQRPAARSEAATA